jgi:SAM-dependent methyltransferase
MRIHHEDLSDAARYIESRKHLRLEDQVPPIENILETIGRFHRLGPETELLEIGVGDGWFQIYCKQKGLQVRGLEISPQLLEISKEIGRRYGVELDLDLGNVEETDLGRERYDVVVARSIFEHVELWQQGVRRIYDALKPGGVFYFDSTNKFSFTSGEYDFPLYGWMPNSWRYRLRRARQGDDIMKFGIDFHQFTYPQLRRHFRRVGFSRVLDLVDFKDVDAIRSDAQWKRVVLGTLKRARPLKHVALNFAPATVFICVK